jgi:hypothetical protein
VKIEPVPGCQKLYGWTDRLEAREYLLKRWERGDMRCNGTHWCARHEMYHLTSKAKTSGKNYRYRD